MPREYKIMIKRQRCCLDNMPLTENKAELANSTHSSPCILTTIKITQLSQP